MKNAANITIRVDVETRAELTRVAAGEQRPVSALARILLLEALAAGRAREPHRGKK